MLLCTRMFSTDQKRRSTFDHFPPMLAQVSCLPAPGKPLVPLDGSSQWTDNNKIYYYILLFSIILTLFCSIILFFNLYQAITLILIANNRLSAVCCFRSRFHNVFAVR